MFQTGMAPEVVLEGEYTLRLSAQKIAQIIDLASTKLSYRDASPLITDIFAQVTQENFARVMAAQPQPQPPQHVPDETSFAPSGPVN